MKFSDLMKKLDESSKRKYEMFSQLKNTSEEQQLKKDQCMEEKQRKKDYSSSTEHTIKQQNSETKKIDIDHEEKEITKNVLILFDSILCAKRLELMLEDYAKVDWINISNSSTNIIKKRYDLIIAERAGLETFSSYIREARAMGIKVVLIANFNSDFFNLAGQYDIGLDFHLNEKNINKIIELL
jgi:hypothetical protein